MEHKDGPQDGSKSNPNPNPGVTVISSEAPSTYHVAPRVEPSTQATGTPPFAPPQPSSTPATGTQPVGMAPESSTPATGVPPSFVWSGPSPGEKKRRGRPRKYDASGQVLSPTPISAQPPADSGGIQSPRSGPQPPSGGGPRHPGGGGPRQPGGGPRQPGGPSDWNGPEFPGEGINLFTGGNFVPHVLIVNPGEDVSEKIQSLYDEEGPRSICVICGYGYISNATLRDNEYSGSRKSYEGRFQIVSLSGSFISTKLLGLDQGLSGGFTITLASPDGRLFGGMLAGRLIAVSPIQIVLGSFMPRTYKEKKERKKKSGFASPSPAEPSTGSRPSHEANVYHPIFEGQDQSHHHGAAAAGTSNDGIGSSSFSGLNLDDQWPRVYSGPEDLAGKSTADANVPPQGE